MTKTLLFFAALALMVIGCGTQSTVPMQSDSTPTRLGDTVRIANDELEYEVIVIDAGFNSWMLTNGRPRGHYSQQYMENRNRTWVIEWNNRARNPRQADMFSMPIEYHTDIDYGYEVNYMLFNYLTYFQLKNNIRLGGHVPRI